MKHFSPWIDIPIAIALYVAVVVGFLAWVHKSSQTSVARNEETRDRLVFRLGVIFVTIGLICYLLDIAFWLVVCVIFILLLSLFAEGFLGILAIPIVALAMFTKEYVLGFPELILSPRESTDGPADLNCLIGNTGSTVTSLRPQGEIEINGQRYIAESESGDLIDRETPVTIVGVKKQLLLANRISCGQ